MKLGEDSVFLGLDLTKQQLNDAKKYNGIEGTNVALKLYYNLSQEELSEYHKIQNDLAERYNRSRFKLQQPIEFNGDMYHYAYIEILPLNDDFITPEKLKHKLNKKLFRKLIQEINSGTYSVGSIQYFEQGITVLEDLNKHHSEIPHPELGDFKTLELAEGLLQKYKQKDNAYVSLMIELNKKFFPFINDFLTYKFLIGFDNVKLDWYDGDGDTNTLHVKITDIAMTIEEVLKLVDY